MWRVLHRYIREADRALAEFNLTHLQFQTLAMAAWLGRSGESVTQAQLARAGDVAPMQVSHMLKALETKGWVRRVRSTADIRAKNVEITAGGTRGAAAGTASDDRGSARRFRRRGRSRRKSAQRSVEPGVLIASPEIAEPHRKAHAATASRDSRRSPGAGVLDPHRRHRRARCTSATSVARSACGVAPASTTVISPSTPSLAQSASSAERAADDLLVRLGQLAADDRAAVRAQRLDRVAQHVGQPAR